MSPPSEKKKAEQAEKSHKADGQQQEESEEESLFVPENEEDNKQSVDDATSRKRRRSSPGSPEAAKQAKINYESTTSANSNDDNAAIDNDTVNENQELLMTTEDADEVIDAIDSEFEGRLLRTHPLPILSRVSARRVLMNYTGKFVLKDGDIRWKCSCGTFIGPKWKDVHSHHNKAKVHTPKGAYEKNQKSNKLPVRRCLMHGVPNESGKTCNSNNGKGWENFNAYHKHQESHFGPREGPSELQTKTRLRYKAEEQVQYRDTDLHYRNWADWAPAEGSRDGQTEFEWADHKFQRFADDLASRREELGEQMSELALQEGSQNDEHTVTAESEENQTEPDAEHDESDKGSASDDSLGDIYL
ncbi:hypothetical protein E8E14_008102 [Neopestalotiopsis sp. 37M]|nr:hypothetical protein E8E14_008102 [Neopestalotiopsis sp. 37M]